MAPTLDRPIFIVGCPRSGTGILHQIVRLHPDVAWITPFTNWICGKSWFRSVPPPLAWTCESLLHRLPKALLPSFLTGPYDGSLGLSAMFETHEGHSIWERALPNAANHLATESEATPDARQYLHDVVKWHLRYHDRPRFLGKTPRNAFRIRFLHALFPDAIIIHLVRDGRAVAASILKRRRQDHANPHQWWGVRPPGWETVQAEPPITQAAWTWKQSLRQVHTDASVLPDQQFIELHYESLTRRPKRELRRLFAFVDLNPEVFFTPENQRQLEKIHPPTESWRTTLQPDQKDILHGTLKSELRSHGYEVADDAPTPNN